MNLKENDQRTKGLDSLLNAETVKYFSMEDWETERYRKAIELYQVATLSRPFDNFQGNICISVKGRGVEDQRLPDLPEHGADDRSQRCFGCPGPLLFISGL